MKNNTLCFLYFVWQNVNKSCSGVYADCFLESAAGRWSWAVRFKRIRKELRDNAAGQLVITFTYSLSRPLSERPCLRWTVTLPAPQEAPCLCSEAKCLLSILFQPNPVIEARSITSWGDNYPDREKLGFRAQQPPGVPTEIQAVCGNDEQDNTVKQPPEQKSHHTVIISI